MSGQGLFKTNGHRSPPKTSNSIQMAEECLGRPINVQLGTIRMWGTTQYKACQVQPETGSRLGEEGGGGWKNVKYSHKKVKQQLGWVNVSINKCLPMKATRLFHLQSCLRFNKFTMEGLSHRWG